MDCYRFSNVFFNVESKAFFVIFIYCDRTRTVLDAKLNNFFASVLSGFHEPSPLRVVDIA